MAGDLVLVLLVTALVAVLPGYPWAACLQRCSDLTERLIFALALSLALVPALAVFAARLTGGGVTLPIAVASPLAVLGAGAFVRLRSGPPKEPGERLLGSPASPDILCLAMIALALALILIPDFLYWNWLRLAIECRGWPGEICMASGAAQPFTLSAGLLIVLAGGVQLLRSPRHLAAPVAGAEAEEKPASSPWATLARRLALPAVVALVLARGYVGAVVHDWPFIRGLDHYSHAVMANRMLSVGGIQPYLIYPPGFHTMTAIVSRLSGMEPLEIFPLMGPACFLLPALSCYALGRGIWGYWPGVAAAFFAGGLMGGSYYYFNDAMYPNLVAAQFLLVMTVAALARLYHAPTLQNSLLVAVLGSSVALFHQVSSMYLLLLLAAVAALVLPYLLLRDRRRGGALLLSLALLGALSAAHTWKTYDLLRVTASLLGLSEKGPTRTAVEMAVGTQNTYDAGSLMVAIISQPVAWLGLLGAVLLAVDLRGWTRFPGNLTRATLLLWPVILFAGSRTSYTGFPQRFARDAGIPLSLLAGLALVLLLKALIERRRSVEIFLASVVVVLAGSLVGLRAVQSYEQAAAPSPHLTMSPGIHDAGEWLRAHNRGGTVMISPQGNQVPSRMMLAMGGYSGLQSFTQTQLNNPRDLPPTGPEPLRDVLYVMNNPAGESVGRLLNKHDVRYIVLYKDMPDRKVYPYWRGFKERPDLYETAFENDDVLIVRRR